MANVGMFGTRFHITESFLLIRTPSWAGNASPRQHQPLYKKRSIFNCCCMQFLFFYCPLIIYVFLLFLVDFGGILCIDFSLAFPLCTDGICELLGYCEIRKVSACWSWAGEGLYTLSCFVLCPFPFFRCIYAWVWLFTLLHFHGSNPLTFGWVKY